MRNEHMTVCTHLEVVARHLKVVADRLHRLRAVLVRDEQPAAGVAAVEMPHVAQHELKVVVAVDRR